MPGFGPRGAGPPWRQSGTTHRVSPLGQQVNAKGGGGGVEVITTLWVGDLLGETTDDDLFSSFQSFGKVLGAQISHRPAASGARSGFVRFASRREAEAALAAASAGLVIILGGVVTCQWARSNTTGGVSSSPAKDYAPVIGRPIGRPIGGKSGFAPMMMMMPVPMGAGASMARAMRWPVSPLAYEELTTLWVGNIAEAMSDADLADTFGAYGRVTAATVSKQPSPMGSYSGFVRFLTRFEAEQALGICSSGQLVVQGTQILAKWAKENSKVDPGLAAIAAQTVKPTQAPKFAPQHTKQGSVQTLFVGSLPLGVTEEQVTEALAEVGVEGVIKLNKPSSKGMSGFIRLDSHEDAASALEVLLASPVEMEGEQLMFDWARSDTHNTA